MYVLPTLYVEYIMKPVMISGRASNKRPTLKTKKQFKQ